MDALDELEQRIRARRTELPSPTERRAIRRAAGVTLEELAAVVGVSRASIGFWESGQVHPRGENLRRYSLALTRIREAVTSP